MKHPIFSKYPRKSAWVASSSRGDLHIGSFAGGLIRLFIWSFSVDEVSIEYQEDLRGWIFSAQK
jgi:hypothetical protein